MLSGASVRYRFYTRWGVTAEELSRIVFSYSVTFWLGLLRARRPEPGDEPAAERAAAAGAAAGHRRRLAAVARGGGVPGRDRRPADAAARVPLRAAAAAPVARRSAAAGLGRRLGAGRSGALRAAAAGQLPFLTFLGVVPRGDPAGHGQPRARRRRRVRRADGAAAAAVPARRRNCCPRWSCTARSTTCCRLPSRSSGWSSTRLPAAAPPGARQCMGRRAHRAGHAAPAGRGVVLLRQRPAACPARRRRRPGGSICSTACCRSASSRRRTSSAASPAPGLLVLSQGLARRLDAAYYLTARR